MRPVVPAALLALALSGCQAGESAAPTTTGPSAGPGEEAALATSEGGSGSSASCVGPYLNTSSPDDPDGTYRSPAVTVRPGEAIVVYGHWYTSTCNDGPVESSLVPLGDVTLVLALPGRERLRLGPFTPAGDDSGFAARVTVPVGTLAGPAVVYDPEMGRSEGYRFVVVGD